MKGLLIAIVLLIVAGGAYVVFVKDKDMMDDSAKTEGEMMDDLGDDIIDEVQQMEAERRAAEEQAEAERRAAEEQAEEERRAEEERAEEERRAAERAQLEASITN